MKKLFLGLVLALGVLAAGGKAEAYIRTNSAGIPYDCTDITYEVTYDYTEAYKLANKINEERAKLGHRQPVVSEGLMRAAMNKAAILNFEFSHEPAVDEGLNIDGKLYDGVEIITTATMAEEAYVNFYESDTGHRQNMLGTMSAEKAIKLGKDAYIGVGIVNGYTCVLFGSDYMLNFETPSLETSDTPRASLTGGILTNYTELFTAHVVNSRMTAEKWNSHLGIAYDGRGLFLEGKKYSMLVGDNYTLTGSRYNIPNYGGLSQHAYSYSVSDPSVLKLEGNSLTAVGAGTATLTMTLNNTNYSKSVTIEVTDPNAAKATTKLSKTSGVSAKRAKASKHRTKLSVSWSKVKDASSYTVQVSTNKKFKKSVTTKTAKKCKLVITKKFKGKKVYVRVRAINGKKTGPWSKVKTIKTYK